MISRCDVLCKAVKECLKECYSYVQPEVSWEDFIEQNKNYKEDDKPPYSFYYLPSNILEDIVENYIWAYNIGSDFEDNVELVREYFKKPVVEVYEENGRVYKDLDPLVKEIGEECFNVVSDYIDKAINFYRRDPERSNFKSSIFLGASPNSCKEQVIENWKKYRNKDIVIDESKYKDLWI